LRFAPWATRPRYLPPLTIFSRRRSSRGLAYFIFNAAVPAAATEHIFALFSASRRLKRNRAGAR
jgi:hypothetical protein